MSIARTLLTTRAAVEKVLHDRSRPAGERVMAVADASLASAAWREDVLIEACNDPDDAVCAAAVAALGRVGAHAAREPLLRVARNRSASVAARARFAAFLMSHRLGLPGEDELDIPSPARPRPAQHPATTEALDVLMVEPAEAETCIRSLASQPLALRLSAKYLARAECEQRSLIVGFNSDIIDGHVRLADLARRKCILGAVAQKHPNLDSYFYHAVLLHSPSSRPQRPNLLGFRLSGECLLTGTAQFRDEEVGFSFASPDEAGMLAVKAEGVATRRGIEMAPMIVTITPPFSQSPQPSRWRAEVVPLSRTGS
jgi:hypothetical protein